MWAGSSRLCCSARMAWVMGRSRVEFRGLGFGSPSLLSIVGERYRLFEWSCNSPSPDISVLCILSSRDRPNCPVVRTLRPSRYSLTVVLLRLLLLLILPDFSSMSMVKKGDASLQKVRACSDVVCTHRYDVNWDSNSPIREIRFHMRPTSRSDTAAPFLRARLVSGLVAFSHFSGSRQMHTVPSSRPCPLLPSRPLCIHNDTVRPVH